MNIRDELELEAKHILKKQQTAEAQLDACPPGRLCIHKNGNSTKWRHVFNDKTSRIIPKKDKKTASQLAWKKYVEDSIDAFQAQRDLIESFLLEYPEAPDFPRYLKDDSPDYRKLIASFFKRRTQLEDWQNESYETNPEHLDHLNTPTRSGIMVRSKSESMIADALYARRIPFRYEQAMTFGDTKLFPDFTIRDPRSPNNIIIWEHLGLMDKPMYINRTKIRLNYFFDAGFIPGINLILTGEIKTHPLDINYVLLLISYYFE